MNLPYRPFAIPVLLAAAALVLSGCSGEGTAKDSESDLPLGPISQRMSDLEERFSDDAAMVMGTAVEESVAACMKIQGFDYTPQIQDSDTLAQAEDMPDWDSAEFAKTYGYGITTWQDLPGMEVTATDEPSETDAPDETLQEGYYEALFGTDLEVDDAEAWVPGGCYGEAMTQIGMEDLLTSTVAQDIDNLALQTDEDDAVVAARDGWVTCMADKGYDYESSEAAQASIQERAYPDDEPLVGDALDTVRDEEIATAVADRACGAGLERSRAEALAQLETDYYADHKSEVDAYFAQLEELLTRS